MSIQIQDIVLYSHDGRSRILPFETGTTNVITGASKTGKSALIGIVDYCLGSGKCNVPDGIIRSAVSWFGLHLKLQDGFAFIARKCPSRSSEASEESFIAVGSDVQIPLSGELHSNTNSSGLQSTLSGWTGIKENIHIPPEGQTRTPLSANVRHGLMLCFQPQDEIIRRNQLFHNCDDHWKAQALKDVLPYLLGAVEDDYVSKQEEMRRLKSELRATDRKLNELLGIRGSGVGKAGALLVQSRDVGLTDVEPTDDWDFIVSTLKQIASTPLSQIEETNTVSDEFDRLSSQREELLNEHRQIQNQIAAVRSLKNAESGFVSEAHEQQSRLLSINVFEGHDMAACPLCSHALTVDTRTPRAQEILESLKVVDDQLERVSRNSPHIEKAIASLHEKLSGIQSRLQQNRDEMKAVRQSDERLSQAKDEATRKSHVLGRVSLYLESLPELPDSTSLENAVAEYKQKIKQLEEELSDDTVQERLDSIVSFLSTQMTQWAQHLGLEHAAHPLRFNLKKLTIVADTPDGPIPMERMGSGENWVGYHLIGHLALHQWMVKHGRPVPRFLFLDQPSQVYFPPEPAADRSVDELKDDDRQDLRRMFQMVFEAVEGLTPDFQVIITEHADINEEWYQNSIRERWRGGLKLVPEDWPAGNTPF